MSLPPERSIPSVPGILAHRANRWKSPLPGWPYDGGMAVVEAAEHQGAWERRRILVALRIEVAGLELIVNAGSTTSPSSRSPTKPASPPARSSATSGTSATSSPRCPSARRSACAGRSSSDPPVRACSTGSMRGSTRCTTAAIPRRRPAPSSNEAIEFWSVILRDAPDVIETESQAPARPDRGARRGGARAPRLRDDDDEKVGVLSAAFAAVIWFVFKRCARRRRHRPLAPAGRGLRPPRAPARHRDRLTHATPPLRELWHGVPRLPAWGLPTGDRGPTPTTPTSSPIRGRPGTGCARSRGRSWRPRPPRTGTCGPC